MIPSALGFASLIDSSDGSGGFFMFDLSTFHSAASAWDGRSIEGTVHVTFLPYPLTGHAWAQSGLRRRSGGVLRPRRLTISSPPPVALRLATGTRRSQAMGPRGRGRRGSEERVATFSPRGTVSGAAAEDSEKGSEIV